MKGLIVYVWKGGFGWIGYGVPFFVCMCLVGGRGGIQWPGREYSHWMQPGERGERSRHPMERGATTMKMCCG